MSTSTKHILSIDNGDMKKIVELEGPDAEEWAGFFV